MEKLSVQVPALYGDHHVSAVRAMLLGVQGVADVYASSAFQLIEVEFDEKLVAREDILAQLETSGYLSDLAVPHESGEATLSVNADRAFYRHTIAHANTGSTVSFSQQVPSAGRALWPCPGIGLLETARKELQNG